MTTLREITKEALKEILKKHLAYIRLSAQIAYHFCRLDSEDPDVKKAQESLKELANKFHRVKECGEIEGGV